MSGSTEVVCPECGCVGHVKIAPVEGAKLRCARCKEWFAYRGPSPSPETITPSVFKPADEPKSNIWDNSEFDPRFVYSTFAFFAADICLALIFSAVAVLHDQRVPSIGYLPMMLLMMGVLASPLAFIMAAFTWGGVYVADQKNRPRLEGALFGLFMGPLGLIVVACLPNVRQSKSRVSHDREECP